jgi:hypothetical protein
MILTPLQTNTLPMTGKLKLFLVPTRAQLGRKEVRRPMLHQCNRICANLELVVDHSGTMMWLMLERGILNQPWPLFALLPLAPVRGSD